MALPIPAPLSLDELAQRFVTPDAAAFGPVPIWWWSGAKLERSRLRWQMEQLLSQGVAQAVIMNLAPTGPLYGSLADDPAFMSEEWWELFLGACEDAKELGFRFWPYDQLGFSGANLQGRIISQHPEWAGRTIGRLAIDLDVTEAGGKAGIEARVDAPLGSTPLGAYTVDAAGRRTEVPFDSDGARLDAAAAAAAAGTRLVLVFSQESGFDYYSSEAFAALMDLVHGEYERRAGHFFGDVIVGIFQDEFPSLPLWGPTFADTFETAFGYDLVPLVGALWNDPIPENSAVAAWQVRLDYQRHRADLARVATFTPMAEWADGHGLLYGFDQQSPAREADPAGSVKTYADYLAVHEQFSAPGSDHWGDPKVHSSLAHAGNQPRTWIEAFHSSGWGGTLEETYDWLAPYLKRGANLYDPHAVYYATPGGWWEWAPPSTCWRQPYWPDYAQFSGAVTRLSELFTRGHLIADTILLFPTSTAQSDVDLGGYGPHAVRASAAYHELNGTPAWYAEHRGVLESAGVDYEIFGEDVIARATVEGGRLRVNEQAFDNVVLPAVTLLHADAARVLAELMDVGGRVLAVGVLPEHFWGDDAGLAERFAAARASGRLTLVENAADVPAGLARGPVWVEASAPTMLREIDGGWVIGLFAHDDETGTEQPILTGESAMDLIEGSWQSYWDTAQADGYTFRPVAGRVASIELGGMAGASLERWNPRTGERTEVVARTTDAGTLVADVEFSDGSVTVLVAARPGSAVAGASPATSSSVVRSIEPDTWTLEARSTLDNRWGDMADRTRDGILPIEVWGVEYTSDGGESWQGVTAGFGTFALTTGAIDGGSEPWETEQTWQPARWSLSRGIEKDPVHGRTLGPKGYVPEEFLDWRDAEADQWRGVRTVLDLTETGPSTLVIGSTGAPTVFVDGERVATSGTGYQSTAPLPAGRVELEIWLRVLRTEPLRASFAVVDEPERYARPEWVEPSDGVNEATHFGLEYRFTLAAIPADARIQVGSEQPCTVIVNGQEIGRQSDFDPYGNRRFGRFMPYDLAELLVVGENTITLVSRDAGRLAALLVDSTPAHLGGIGVRTGSDGWTATREGRTIEAVLRPQQWSEIRQAALVPRPHPLPGASWLENPPASDGVVAPIVPAAPLEPTGALGIAFDAPVGAVSFVVATALAFTAALSGEGSEPIELMVEGTSALLPYPAPAGSRIALTFAEPAGRREGALLESGIRFETAEVEAPLADWTELGLTSLAGEVVYRTRASVGRRDDGQRVVLDLGVVRGSVSVRVNGTDAGRLAFGPYVLDITDAVSRTDELLLEVTVRNTLAGYLTFASPTPGVFAGQEKAGLHGPVRVEVRDQQRVNS